jgi:glutathione S-transferase
MSFILYFHPLASFCHKALIALYEKDIPFERVIVEYGNERSLAEFKAVWPMAKMPALRDTARHVVVAESTIVIEYVDQHSPGPRLVPADPDSAWRVRFWDRFFDHYVEHPMQKIVLDRLRPPGESDAFGVAQARDGLTEAYAYIEERMAGRTWIAGDDFSLAECSAAPALFYANTIVPLGNTFPATAAYLARLMTRPSFARVLEEAEPYFGNFPLDPKPTRTPPRISSALRSSC